MEYETALAIYGAGVAAWCFLMSAQGERVDKGYFLSAFLWPFMFFHMAGALLNRALTRRK